MPTRHTASIQLPPVLLREVERVAKRLKRTPADVVCIAVRQHLEREKAWQRARAYGRKKAKQQGITSEQDIVWIIKEFRRGRSAPRRAGNERRLLSADPAEAIRRSAGGWEGSIDAEKLIRDISRSRRVSTRPVPRR